MADHENEQTPEDEPVTEEPTVDEPAAAEPEAASPAAPAAKPRRRPKPKAAEEPKRKKAPARKKQAERKSIVRLPKPEHARGRRKERRGVVVSSAMDKTIVVRVDVAKPHPKYRKVVRRSQKLHAHDELNVAKAGDVVRLVETRPISALKRWRLAEVLEEAK
jgi:small subunit ribosomal protein S17